MTHNPQAKSRTKLALGATIVLAAAPVSVFAQVAPDAAIPPAPAAAAPAPAAPTIVIPEVAPAPAPVPSASAPVATAPIAAPAAPVATVADAPAPAPRQSTRTAKPVAPRAAAARQSEAAPVAASAAVAPAAAPVRANDLPADPVVDQIDGAPPVAAVNPAPAAPADNGVPAGLLAAIGLAAVAGAGVFALRRRRTYADEADDVYVAPTEPVDLTPEPIAPAEARPLELTAPVVASIPVAAASRQSASPLLVEGEPVPTGEARQELLDRMVAAEPDEANPFRTAQARRKRARLILQSHDARAAELEQARETDPSFDWRKWQGSRPNGAAPTVTPARVPEPVA